MQLVTKVNTKGGLTEPGLDKNHLAPMLVHDFGLLHMLKVVLKAIVLGV